MRRPQTRRQLYWTAHDARNKEFRPYVTAAGQASLQWNILHEAMGLLFANVMGTGYLNQVGAVWSSAPSDRAKRNMLKAAVHARQAMIGPGVPAREALTAKRIDELVGLAEALEIKRNDVVHAPLTKGLNALTPTYGKVFPDTLLGNVRAKPLEGKDLLKEFRYCRDYARILAQFAKDIDRAMTSGVLPLPDKPLPPRRDGKKTERRRHRPSRARPQHQPRSSQE